MVHSDDVLAVVRRSPAGFDGLVRRAKLTRSHRRVSLGVLVFVDIAYALASLGRRPLAEDCAKGRSACRVAASCCSCCFGVHCLVLVVIFVGINNVGVGV